MAFTLNDLGGLCYLYGGRLGLVHWDRGEVERAIAAMEESDGTTRDKQTKKKGVKSMSKRAEALAARVELGARELIAFVEGCSDAEWEAYVPDEGRTAGVLVHHVATMYPVELDLVKTLASGQAIAGVTWEMVDQMNAQHEQEHADCSKEGALELLKRNSALAADGIRALSDEELDRAAPISLHWDAPLTTQYFIEEHPIGHSFHHLASIRAGE